jgi:hypothetical protein
MICSLLTRFRLCSRRRLGRKFSAMSRQIRNLWNRMDRICSNFRTSHLIPCKDAAGQDLVEKEAVLGTGLWCLAFWSLNWMYRELAELWPVFCVRACCCLLKQWDNCIRNIRHDDNHSLQLCMSVPCFCVTLMLVHCFLRQQLIVDSPRARWRQTLVAGPQERQNGGRCRS